MKIKIKKPNQIGIKIHGKKIYPELENLVVIPSGEEQKFKSNKYGFDEVICKAVEGITEDLTEELTEQDSLLITQEALIKQIIQALQEKTQDNTSTTIEEIEQLLVLYFENKTVEEVEV